MQKRQRKESDPDLWEEFKEHTKLVKGLEDSEIFDKIAIFPVVDAVSKGICNKDIAKHLQIDEESVMYDLRRFSDFVGFSYNTDLSPIKVFRNNRENFTKIFRYRLDDDGAARLEKFLENFEILKEELDKYYEKE